MGLDGVELIISVEERFGVAIQDEEASRVLTAGDLHDHVMTKLTPQGSKACLTSHAFYRLRGALQSLFGVARKAVSPEVELSGLLPSEGRRNEWGRLARSLGWRLPELERSRAVAWGIPALCLAAVPAGIVTGMLDIVSAPVAWAIGLGAVPLLWLAYRLTEPVAVHLPRDCITVGAAARTVLAHNFDCISQECQSWNEQEVWQSLKAIIVAQIGCQKPEVTKEARFAEDLGVD